MLLTLKFRDIKEFLPLSGFVPRFSRDSPQHLREWSRTERKRKKEMRFCLIYCGLKLASKKEHSSGVRAQKPESAFFVWIINNREHHQRLNCSPRGENWKWWGFSSILCLCLAAQMYRRKFYFENTKETTIRISWAMESRSAINVL